MYNIMRKLLSVLLLLALMPQAALAEYYGIKVGGVSVTSDNCDNITGSNIWSYGYSQTRTLNPAVSRVSYDPETKTLTLKYIQIERTGSGNRAILNESCDGLTIVFEDTNFLYARDASPIRLNANTTIKSASGKEGFTQKIQGGNEGAITVGNGATLLIEDIELETYASESSVFVGNTGTERLVIMDAYVWAQGDYSVRNLSTLGVQNSHLGLDGRTAAAKDLKNFSMAGRTMYATDTFYDDGTQNFLNASDNSVAKTVAITNYVEINETNFPDDTFRSYVSEEFDEDNDGRLTFREANTNYFKNTIDVSNKGLTSLKGIEHFLYLEELKCADNNLTSLDVSKLPRLRNLDCHSNQLTSLNVTKEKEHYSLFTLDCYLNQLTRLDIPQGVHEKLNCSYNKLTYIDFSHCSYSLHNIYIYHNRIDAFMTETLESLLDVTESKGSDSYRISISSSTTNDNVCTGAQADIARNKGWDVYVAGLDGDGNVVYDIEIGGTMVTSANADDLTALPGVTKNCDDGYAYFNPTKQTLYLNGVDIVNEDGEGINFDRNNASRIIELGQEPVNITSKNAGIHYNYYNGDGSLTITTKESNWYSEQLNIVSTEGKAIHIEKGSLSIEGAARVVAKSADPDYDIRVNTGTLYIKNDAELRIKANEKAYAPLYAGNLVLEDDNIIVTPERASFPEGAHSLINASHYTIRSVEVVLGKLREFNCYVGGTRVSNANLHAVLGDTTVVFQEPAFQGGRGTLVLNNANVNTGSDQGISGNNLNIKLIGENTVIGNNGGIAGSSRINIEGPGSLYVKGQYGIDLHLAKLFISDDAQVTAEGTTRYAIDGKETTISGAQTIVRMKCEPDARGTFRASTSLTLNDGIIIDEPEGAQYFEGEIKDASGNVIKDEWVTLQYTERYGIKVAGIKVTNHNMADVLGDGTVSYDPETLTLTLTDATIDGGDGSGIEAEQELHIKLEGSNTITCTRSLNGTSHGIWFKDKGYIEGPGSLSITAMYGIFAIGNNQPKALQILDGAQISAEGDLKGIIAGITTISGEETVVNAKGGDGSFGCTALNLNDQLEITQPAGASFNLTKLAICVGRRNDIVTSWVTIQKVNKYDVYVAGTQVTSLNQADVLGDGRVSYDAETNTLTLNNANIETEAETEFVISAIEINIRLEGENKIMSKGSGIMGQTLNIEATTDDSHGPGTLDIIASYTGIRATNSLNVCGGAHVTAESTGSYAILTQFLTVSGAETVLGMKGEEGTYSGFAPKLEDGLELTQPIGAYYNEETGHIVNAEGEPIKGEWVVIGAPVSVESYEILIAGIQVTELNKDDILGDGTVSYNPKNCTLTLNGANIAAEDNVGIIIGVPTPSFCIELTGENTIEGYIGINVMGEAEPEPKMPKAKAAAIPEVCITGSGSLHAIGTETGIRSDLRIVIDKGAQVKAEGSGHYGISSLQDVIVCGAENIVMMKGNAGACQCEGLTLENGLVLGIPTGAAFSAEAHGIVNAEGNVICGEWVIIGSEDYITGIDEMKNEELRIKNGVAVYNLAGQRVGEGYKGIVIEGGQKVLKK